MDGISARDIAIRLKAKKSGDWWMVLGQCHNARTTPSLHFRDSVSGGIAVKCHAGCDRDSAREALFRMAGVTETPYAEQAPFTADQKASIEADRRVQEQRRKEAVATAKKLLRESRRGKHLYTAGHNDTNFQSWFTDVMDIDSKGGVANDATPQIGYDVLICQGLRISGGRELYSGWVLVPMYDYWTDNLQSLQFIPPPDSSESKKFLAGGKASGAVYKWGTRKFAAESQDLWLAEGYETARSVHEGLKPLGINAAVWTCFSASNMGQIAKAMHNKRLRMFIVADHDLWTCKGCKKRWDGDGDTCPACGSDDLVEPTGEKYARESHLPYWMPPTPGDANDYMLDNGIAELTNALSRFRAENI